MSPEDFLAYCYAVIAHPAYTTVFAEPLEASPVRVPITSEPALFWRAVDVGRNLLWLHTYGSRYTGPTRPAHNVPRRDDLVWLEPVTKIPGTTKDLSYNEDARQLHVGDGIVSGVTPQVREFSVSGMNIIDKWLGARTAKGIGKASQKTATPLDKIRPTEWEDEWNDELLDLLRVLTATTNTYPEQAELLDDILAANQITVTDLPTPTDTERHVPKTNRTPPAAKGLFEP